MQLVDDNDYDDDDDGDVDDVNNEDYVDEEHLLLIRGCSGPLDLAVTAFSAHACRVVLFNDCEWWLWRDYDYYDSWDRAYAEKSFVMMMIMMIMMMIIDYYDAHDNEDDVDDYDY